VQLAAESPLTARLMRTPLQVTIMSLLLERLPRPPQERHALFDAYYETVYAREAAKRGFLAKLLDEHRADINAVHEQVGLQLQVLAESAQDAEAVLPSETMTEVVAARLHSEGYTGDALARLTADLVRTATERLVLLVPKGLDGVGFEVRSLQEFMAGRSLINAADEAVLARLALTARSSHWRNTWLLAVGRIFSKAEHLRSRVIALLREFDAKDALSAVIPPGPESAVDLLDDDVAARSPLYRRQLTQHALEILPLPSSSSETVARVLYDLSADKTLRALIGAALDQALAADPAARFGARSLVLRLQHETGELAAHARRLINASRLPEQQPGRYLRLSSAIEAPLSESGLTGPSREAADLFLAEIHRVRRDFTNGPVDLPPPGRLWRMKRRRKPSRL
jgi:hypothetical protein